jgi:hypothetical protein
MLPESPSRAMSRPTGAPASILAGAARDRRHGRSGPHTASAELARWAGDIGGDRGASSILVAVVAPAVGRKACLMGSSVRREVVAAALQAARHKTCPMRGRRRL